MIFYRSIIPLAVLLFCSFCSRAQDNNYVYQDSTVLFQDSVEAAVKAIENSKEMGEPGQMDSVKNEDEYIADTMLHSNQLLVEPDSVKALKNARAFAYAKNLDSLLYHYQQRLGKEDASSKNEVSWLGRLLVSPVTKTFFWILAVFFVSFILYRLFFSESFFQRRSAAVNVTILPEEKENVSKTADYGKLITRAVGAGNYRAAVRYHYLQVLQKLSLKGAIRFTADKTNHEYLMELGDKKYKNDFASLTRQYEYVWYGEFEIDEKIYGSIQNRFKQFNSEV